MLKRNTFAAQEEDIFVAVQNWSKEKSVAERDIVVAMVRLPLMAIGQLLNIVQPSGLVQDNLIFNAIREKISFDSNTSANCILHLFKLNLHFKCLQKRTMPSMWLQEQWAQS